DRRFVIEWRNVSIRGPDVTVDFEVILHENGLIETQYRNIGALEEEKGICATIGIEDPSGSIAFSYSYDRPLITAPEHAALYRPPASSQSPYPDQPFTVPGFIQAEDFDRGGEGVAYHDNVPGNAGALYRPNEDVDIIDPYAGGYV